MASLQFRDENLVEEGFRSGGAPRAGMLRASVRSGLPAVDRERARRPSKGINKMQGVQLFLVCFLPRVGDEGDTQAAAEMDGAALRSGVNVTDDVGRGMGHKDMGAGKGAKRRLMQDLTQDEAGRADEARRPASPLCDPVSPVRACLDW